MQILYFSPVQQTASLLGSCAALVLCVGACAPGPADTSDAGSATGSSSAPAATAAANTSAAALSERNVLGLEGLGMLRLGEPVPPTSSWIERGAQVPGSCTTITSPEFPGVYAIVEARKVQRVTVGGQSEVKLREGIGVGTPEAEVRAAFPNFREEPHKYVESPAKYLTSPDAVPGRVALRFEIDRDGKVGFIHVGLMPVLAYVEGCA
ncbi:hypothetical protein [Porphyrobacter sp. ULC335]|uniref:hypothetical protein n=1 Tax=Porphyrobacter sp. ULC335 TaxID=2854260 RepID=UPI0022204588|nr:hypothetical protein [Porphyrobacter sp. ULC335]UYV16682.1 hypothetical protein KVF90_04995 [Porphyrobacter sp. ULC335]